VSEQVIVVSNAKCAILELYYGENK